MRFLSTSGQAPAVSFAQAIQQGLAPDGGLYMPERIPEGLSAAWSPHLAPWQRAIALLSPFIDGELSEPTLAAICREALSFPMPLVSIDDRTYLLELFHGPSLAFKDIGARFLARFLAHLGQEVADEEEHREPLTVLVATSGDTGGAVAQAFHRVADTQVVILYPHGATGGVTAFQERQFATLGDNIRALAVEGTFDDCQRLVKEAFRDRRFADLRLTSANSINLGRLLPQAIYYAHAVAHLPPDSEPPLFVVPSGNFGNLAAGLLAARAGLPVRRFIAATNANDVVPRYLESGHFEPRPSQSTLANAMDVGNPSNLARINHLFAGDLQALRAAVWASSHSDPEIRQVLRQVHDQSGLVLDPHTAVGYCALQKYRQRHKEPTPAILLATAHPAKFAETLEPILGRPIRLAPQLAQAHHDRPIDRDYLEPTLDALRLAFL